MPWVDLPDKNVEKISWYRTWENRFNTFDGNIPGNDYQFPVDLEGALGYNNQISLTVPMRLQDLQFWRDPLYSYGPWLSQGEESGCQSFHDNPGNTGNWNNTYEQWTALQAWESYKVHGGPIEVLQNLARYSECDVKETLAKFDTNGDNLIEYPSGTLPGNDADSVAFKYYGTGTRPQDRTESSFWYAGAKASAEEYALLGNTAKAAEMNGIADQIRDAILTQPVGRRRGHERPRRRELQRDRRPRPWSAGQRPSSLCGTAEYVNVPAGIVSGLHDFTISVWVNPSVDRTWSRIFDFGTGTTRNMFLTMDGAGIGPRFAITTCGSGGEQQLTAARPAAAQHLVAPGGHASAATTGTLYINGAAVATNPSMTIDPADLGATNQNWIGRSQYGDPLLAGTVDDFHIYDHALTADEVASLAAPTQGAGNVAAYRFDEASGATAVDSSGNGRDATIVSETKPTITCPGERVPPAPPADRQPRLLEGPAELRAVHRRRPARTPPSTRRPCVTTPTRRSSGSCRSTPPTRPTTRRPLACGPCDHGSNNFSNINATLQARLYSKAIRDYPTPYITNGMYRKLIEWLSWNEDIDGDNRFPDNNEFFFNWNPDDPDPRPVGHPPRRPRLVQLDGLPGHRRPPAAAGRHASSSGRSTWATTTSPSTT